MLAVVEDHLEHPAGVVDLRRAVRKRGRLPRVVQQRRAVAVADALEVAVGRAARVVAVAPVALVRLRQIDAGAVLRLVLVEDGVALVVALSQISQLKMRLASAGSAMRRLGVLAVAG